MTDRIGRKPILIWNGLLVFLSYACRTVDVFFDLNLYLFVIAVMVNGFSDTVIKNDRCLFSGVTSDMRA
jgi:hypothetical protein